MSGPDLPVEGVVEEAGIVLVYRVVDDVVYRPTYLTVCGATQVVVEDDVDEGVADVVEEVLCAET